MVNLEPGTLESSIPVHWQSIPIHQSNMHTHNPALLYTKQEDFFFHLELNELNQYLHYTFKQYSISKSAVTWIKSQLCFVIGTCPQDELLITAALIFRITTLLIMQREKKIKKWYWVPAITYKIWTNVLFIFALLPEIDPQQHSFYSMLAS